jgi:hypothetical protein
MKKSEFNWKINANIELTIFLLESSFFEFAQRYKIPSANQQQYVAAALLTFSNLF